ncbi:hypothetical protein D5S17_35625 [Pseudonocardiaceae bacterium YIM PH 21723]|nr:hypothetical protein D5S17_35625 [Pseudonocardiaceae bacterium YIM PH 21723]
MASAVALRVQQERVRETTWWAEELDAVLLIEDPAERRAARAELQSELERRRASGKFRASRDALLRHAIEELLSERGWTKRYRPIPAGAASIPGRPWGKPLENGQTGDKQGRLSVNLPEKLWEQVRRIAYWESAPAVAKLQKWHRRFGDGPGWAEREGNVLAMMVVALGPQPRAEDMQERRELRDKIITTGDILRDAAYRAVRT